ncbi:hypothetical protein HZ989_00735 [Brevundimonas sp. AJA228-03]|uniref:hypothetical protein n=1 Tax=Brevundimonas sp. AJA228-03 TaxID=2752515 RepID=UPI001ADECEF2|nr:hypothetical protein [Brevundimonas sp. AJA228-03]QTN19644.1 hypothetical protein HZ989_00735 [Brevundimonas sp. AJA228-03]
MSYSQDFPPADAVYAPSTDGLILDLPPLVLGIGLLLLLLAGCVGWWLAQHRQPTSASATAAIWKDIDEAIRAAMTAHSDSLRDKARDLTRTIETRLGRTLTLTGGLTGLEALDAALDEAPHDDAHAGAHDHHHTPDHGGGHDDDHDGQDVDASGSTVVIERARHVIIHAPAPAPAPTPKPGHDKPKPVPTEAERRQAIRQAVSDLNDHWRLKEARIAELEAARRELSAPPPVTSAVSRAVKTP